MLKKIRAFIFLAAVAGIIIAGIFARSVNDNSVGKINANDHYKYIAANQLLIWMSNNGDAAFDPRTGGSGAYWPGGENATLTCVFEDGLIWGGKIGREIRVGGSTYRHGLQAGYIDDDGIAADPAEGGDHFRVYRIKKGWENLASGSVKEAFQRDYEEWPMDEGAPYEDIDGSGDYTPGVDVPAFVGDEVVWFVANDLDASRTTFLYGTLPLGLEMQMTAFAFNRTGDLGDIVFKKYLLINKGNNTIRDMVLGYWSDTDLGDASDDYTGSDTTLSLGYTYNGDGVDAGFYEDKPPADGYDFFQGPIIPSTDPLAIELGLPDSAKFLGKWRKGVSNLPMTAFTFYINNSNVYSDPDLGVAQGSVQFYNYLTGKVWDGSPFINPITGQESKFVLTGDPVAGTGWYEGDGWPGDPTGGPGDRRHLIASGKFDMAPGDTQEVVVGFLIAQGTDNINSITELKRKDDVAQIAYDLDFNLTPAPPAPKLSYYVDDALITFYWNDTSETYDEVDPIIIGKGFDDTTYTFQGYRFWQFTSLAGTDPVLIGTWDLADTVKVIWDYQSINGINVKVPIMSLANEGLQRFITVTSDAETKTPLRNGTPYYFGVSAFGYSPNSVPAVLESPPVVVQVTPAAKKIDYTSPYESNEHVVAPKVEGDGDGKVIFKVIDPEGLTGDTYRVEIGGTEDTLRYDLIDVTRGDTLAKDQTDFLQTKQDEFKNWVIMRQDTLGAKLYEGFQLFVSDVGSDSLKVYPKKYRVKELVEIANGSGIFTDPVNVWDNLNSTKKWKIIAKDDKNSFIWQTSQGREGLGYGSTYEIRFTDRGSQYYLSGYGNYLSPPITKDDTLAADTVPFEIWDLGATSSDTDDVRLTIKILDNFNPTPERANPDMKFSRIANGDWEEIYCYYQDGFYDADGNTIGGSLPPRSGRSSYKDHKFGSLSFRGELPKKGTVIRMTSWSPLYPGAVFEETLNKAEFNNTEIAKNNIDKISVFPNPYFASNDNETDKYTRQVRFIGLPKEVTIRIYSLSGVFVNKLEKSDNSQFMDWNLLNKDNLPVASGIYLAYVDMPGIGTKIMKLAIIQEQQYIDRL